MKNKDKFKIRIAFILGILGILGVAIFEFFIIKLQQDCIDDWKKQEKKDRGLFLLMDQWTNLRQEGKSLKEFFLKNNYKKIAIYGMSYVGLRLIKELRHSDIEIAYGIDRNADNIYSNLKLVTMNDDLPYVDAVIVTAISGYDEIYDALSEKVDYPIISIEDILNGAF